MPNRILKESITYSASIDRLTWFEECFFYRLIVICDDYGRTDARTALLKARLFPLKGVTEKQIGDALHKLSTVGIVHLYEVDGGSFLQLVSWKDHQQIRNKRSKFPAPESNCKDLISIDINNNQPQSNVTVIQSESELESNTPLPPEGEAPAAQEAKKPPNYGRVLELFRELCPSLPSPKEITKPRQGAINSAGQTLRKHDLKFQQLFARVEASDFLTGRDGQWDKCGFDWVLKPANLQKILEGNYDNKKTKGDGGSDAWETV